MKRDIEDIVADLRSARSRESGGTLLIGAGCSVAAGIPLAGGFVKEIEKRFPTDFKRAGEKTYAHCMNEMAPGDRRDLIAEYVRKARINWAHVCIAALMKEGYVDRVLTTNFDNLVIRACALLGEFPAVYDLAGSQFFKPADIPRKAVFYLHGQHTGFVLRNTPEEVEEQSKALGPVFEDNGRRRPWMVVGYSGRHDPVFDHLAAVPSFDYRLYWVGYQDEEPADYVRTRLLTPSKHAFHVGGYDADSFFVTLAQRLGIFPPHFVGKPFSYLEAILETLTPYTFPGQEAQKDVTRASREWIRAAAERFERAADAATDDMAGSALDGSPSGEELRGRFLELMMKGDYAGVVTLAQTLDDVPSGETADTIAWAYVILGATLAEEAEVEGNQEAYRLRAEAQEKYRAALEVKPGMHEALYNWGLLLHNWAEEKEGAEADRLRAEAQEKYRAALETKPDMHEALYSWGLLLQQWAEEKEGAEADRLRTEAQEKYRAALETKPDMHEALYNLAVLLYSRATHLDVTGAEPLYAEAEALLRHAEEIKPGFAAYDLACCFAVRGDDSSAREWLERSRDLGTLPDLQHLQADPDLENVRESRWFEDFVRSVYPDTR